MSELKNLKTVKLENKFFQSLENKDFIHEEIKNMENIFCLTTCKENEKNERVNFEKRI
jgi:hypothetical protein